MVDLFGVLELEKERLSLLSGLGFMAIVAFFYFFMGKSYSDVYSLAYLSISLSVLMVLFFLFDKIKYTFDFITDTNSNFVAGMLFFMNIVVIIIAFQRSADAGVRILLIGLLTAFSVFLFLYSMLMEDY